MKRYAKVSPIFLDNVLRTKRLDEALKQFKTNGQLPQDTPPETFGLPLSYIEDRLIATLQTLTFESHSYGNRENLPTRQLTPEAQAMWGWTEPVPVLTIDRNVFMWAYLGADQKLKPSSAKWQDHAPRSDAQQRVFAYLETLADRTFTLAHWPPNGENPKCVQSTLFALRYAYRRSRRIGLEIALSPILLVHIYRGYRRTNHNGSHYIERPTDLHHRIEQTIKRPGIRPALLPRLYYALKRRPANGPWHTPTHTLATELRQPEPTTKAARAAFCELIESNLVILERAKVLPRRPRFDPNHGALRIGPTTDP
jgi:hypothetical protein